MTFFEGLWLEFIALLVGLFAAIQVIVGF